MLPKSKLPGRKFHCGSQRLSVCAYGKAENYYRVCGTGVYLPHGERKEARTHRENEADSQFRDTLAFPSLSPYHQYQTVSHKRPYS